MTCERLSKGNSILHRADPRIKIFFSILLSIEIVYLNDFLSLFLALLFSIFLIVITRIETGIILKRILIINFFVFFLWLTIPFSYNGSHIFSIGPLKINYEGVIFCLKVTLKCNAIVLFNMALLSTSSIFYLAHALDHLYCPSILVQLFFFSWRYLHVIEEEYTRLKRAATLRGFKPKANLLTYKTYANILGSLFVRSYDRGQRVYNAMVLRGFNGTFWLLKHFSLSRLDIFLSFFMLLLIFTLLAINGRFFFN